MPQVMSAMSSTLREGKKRRGHGAHLDPRSSPPTRAPITASERLPPIRSLLSDIPNQSERSLSHFRTPMREDATGPRPAIPARLSPPPPSRRSHIQSLSSATNGATKSSRPVEDKSSSRSCYDSKPIYQLPIHAGPPSSRSSYSPSTLNPPPASPYSTTSTDTRWEYSSSSSRDSHSLPAPPTPYSSLSSSRSSSYAPSGNYRKGDPVYGGQYPGDAPGRDARSAGMPAYQQLHPSYQSVQYGYPPPPPPPNGNYAVSHHCQSGYHNGSTQFESDESGGHAPRRRRGNLPRDTTDMLKQWFADHLAHPYPTEDEKQMLCRQTGLQMTQISNWFINARRRRIPELMNQATAERRLRENSGESSGGSD